MPLFYRTHAALVARLRQIAREPDRGDSPIPSSVIIVGMALLAVGLLLWLGTYVSSLLEQAPTDLPDQNF